MKKLWSTLAVSAMAFGFAAAAEAEPMKLDPYGVCAHVSRGEWQVAPQTFDRMKEADIRWARTDFDWKYSEKEQGKWEFDHLDRLLKLAEQEGISILPILDYDVPWASPAWKHLDLWANYVRTLVARYPQLQYWEVWNEQNSRSFWHDTPSGENYTKLLKRSYQEIKSISPDKTVLYGGTAGVPLAFIEDSLKAGAGDFFDVMNIHPYHWRGVPEEMFGDLKSVREVMTQYGVGHKPIWITEVGWATAEPPRFYVDILPSVLTRAGIDPSQCDVAVINDPELGFFEVPNFNADFNLGMFRKVDRIKLADLDGLDVKKYPVLLPSASEEFPMSEFGKVIDYVKRGGTLILPAGLPFYHDMQLDGKGNAKKVQVGSRDIGKLHIGWETWWVNDKVPGSEKWQKPAKEFTDKFKVPFRPTGGRYFTANNLKPGDEFIPIIEAGDDNYTGAICALYKFNSDLKGNIIAYSGMGVIDSTTQKRQAEMLPRTYLVALSEGVERIFWYNFRAGEWQPDEREHHFGVVHKDLTPKPAFHAFRTLTTMLPAKSTRPVITTHGKAYLANWARPDGKKVWAIWTADAPQPLKIKISGNVEQAIDYMGEKVATPTDTYKATPALLYLVGPDAVDVQL